MTNFPNHPTGIVPEAYRGRSFQIEHAHGLRVIRCRTYATPNRGFVKRTLGHLVFMFQAVWQATPALRGSRRARRFVADAVLGRRRARDRAPREGALRVRGPRPLAGDLRRARRDPQPLRDPRARVARARALPPARRGGDRDPRVRRRHRSARDRPRQAPRDPQRRRPRRLPTGAARAGAPRPARARRTSSSCCTAAPTASATRSAGSSRWPHGCETTRGSTSCSSAREPRRTPWWRAPASCSSAT